ncbi:hypothetical protein I7I50_03124 [Histoplasma capsulatum G186AR]|uniref:Uncharacterized protein n=1 Tax=Ajellomyces capsulatus TaxID=5037 RepID=A0A8H7Z4L0_AJECA|nr:hypothetical protein I7I52_00206 [Histoplasma capsulatum]QSS72068.1 hypothetical protein I7I50_03124 [Histoplasma capsulatum G186AR]
MVANSVITQRVVIASFSATAAVPYPMIDGQQTISFSTIGRARKHRCRPLLIAHDPPARGDSSGLFAIIDTAEVSFVPTSETSFVSTTHSENCFRPVTMLIRFNK